MTNWFQGYTSGPGERLRVYEGDGFRNRLIATAETKDAACLIAAAPALLDALRLASNKFAFVAGLSDPMNVRLFAEGAKKFCDDAIAKAEPALSTIQSGGSDA